MTEPMGPPVSGEGLVPEKLDQRLRKIHEIVQSVLANDYSKNVSIYPKADTFAPLERDVFNLVIKMREMNSQTELAISKIREALTEIISLTNTVKDATESIKKGEFNIPFDAESSISEIRELKKRFQYLISVIRLLSAESMMGDK